METFQSHNHEDLESNRAQWSVWGDSSDNESVRGSNLMLNQEAAKDSKNRPTVIVEESKEEEVEDSFTLINDLLNPFNSIIRYLTKNGYINKKDPKAQDNINYKLLAWVEEFSQNFYYAFIAQTFLRVGKGILNPSQKLIPGVMKLFSRKSLMMCALMAILGAGYKLGIEKLRNMSAHHDKINTIVSIGLAVFSLMQNQSKMKKQYMFLFLFWKYIEMMSKILEKGKVIKKVKKLEVEFYELCILSFSLRFSFKVNISRKEGKE